MLLCQSATVCEPFLQGGFTYTGCKFGDESIQNTFNVYIETRHEKSTDTDKSRVCDKNSDGKWLTTDCGNMQSYKFVPKADIGVYDSYILSCGQIGGVQGNTAAEVPDIGRIRFQMALYDTFEKSSQTVPMRPIQEIRCIAQCMEFQVHAKLTTTVPAGALCNKDKCTIKATASPAVGVFTCGGISFQTKVSYSVKTKFSCNLTTVHSEVMRVKQVYDAGEVITCQVFDAAPVKGVAPMSLSGVKINIFKRASPLELYSSEDDFQAEIPHMAPPDLMYMCFWGNRSQATDPAGFYKIKEGSVSIGAKYRSYVLSDIAATLSESVYDFPRGARIYCNKSSYPGASNVLITLFTLPKFTLPLSDFRTMPGVSLTTEVKSVIINAITSKTSKVKRFVVCKADAFYSTPVPIFCGDRPKVKWVYVNPPWPTKYHLHGFVVACKGTYVNNLKVSCENCPSGHGLSVMNQATTLAIIEVPMTIQSDIDASYSCSGTSDTYPDEVIRMDFNVIVSQYTDLDHSIKFLQVDADNLTCKSQFTVFKGTSHRASINMMTFMYIDNIEYRTSAAKPNLQIFNPHPNAKSVLYEYCCPYFDKNKYKTLASEFKCITKREVDIAKSYKVQYNIHLDNIFPGNTVRCYICLNFTTDTENHGCSGPRKVQSNIYMNVRYPNSTVADFNHVTEVVMPVEEIKPDKKSYYNVDDYHVSLGCFVRTGLIVRLRRVYLKSCNTNPPKVQIVPTEKTMFMVGEIFSCTTRSLNCKNGLTYHITVQRGTDPPVSVKMQSFRLTKRNTGNMVLIKCTAGMRESSHDKRYIRVEHAPYNVSIVNLKPIMMHTEYLKCMSLGFPYPDLQWTQKLGPTQLRISEGMMLVGPWDSSGQYEVECLARNKRGSDSAYAEFEVFNPRIVLKDEDVQFYLIVSLSTTIYILIMMLGLTLIFQETLFGKPFFSPGTSVASVGSGQTKIPSVRSLGSYKPVDTDVGSERETADIASEKAPSIAGSVKLPSAVATT